METPKTPSEELSAEWDRFVWEHDVDPADLIDLIKAERRLAMARALRFAAECMMHPTPESLDVFILAERLEQNEVAGAERAWEALGL